MWAGLAKIRRSPRAHHFTWFLVPHFPHLLIKGMQGFSKVPPAFAFMLLFRDGVRGLLTSGHSPRLPACLVAYKQFTQVNFPCWHYLALTQIKYLKVCLLLHSAFKRSLAFHYQKEFKKKKNLRISQHENPCVNFLLWTQIQTFEKPRPVPTLIPEETTVYISSEQCNLWLRARTSELDPQNSNPSSTTYRLCGPLCATISRSVEWDR